MRRLPVLLLLACACWMPAQAFPQYEEWISKKAGFQTDCAYCHANAAGPLGAGKGQEGALDPSQKNQLHTPDSPVLNAFGKHLLDKLGYAQFLSGMSDPASVADKMKKYDLDGDGVSDGDEMERGSLADDPLSAPAGLAWQKRLKDNGQFVAIVTFSALLGASGLFALAGLTRNKSE